MITDPDEVVAAALEDVSVPALIAAVTYFTADPAYLRGTVRPRTFIPNDFQGGLEERELAELRRQATQSIIAYRDQGCPPIGPPDIDIIQETMSWLACEKVSEEYVPMFIEEMNIGGDDPRRIAVNSIGDEVKRSISVLVIGAGQSGLLAGIRLKQAGIPFTIIEKNSDVGGTWIENTYPGCRVDVGNHFYCYSFEPNDAFTEFYSQQPELLDYFHSVARRWDLYPHVRTSTEVLSATWVEGRCRWRVNVSCPQGQEQIEADVVISAVGQLNRPLIPKISGLETFGGPVFHSARWNHTVKLAGKRVAMIGAGASGFQIAPAIAENVERLVVFQRTAQWMAPNPKYRQLVGEGAKWAMRYVPGYAAWYRFMLLYQASDKALAVVKIDPEWSGLPYSANSASEERRKLLVKWIEQNVGDDPDLLGKVLPDYPPMGKRMLQDDGSWLRCLRAENVDLVRDPIVRIEPGAIVTDDQRYEVDVIIMATGFRANEFLSPIEFVGRDGHGLTDMWGTAPAAHLGITVPKFPNLFLMYGPGTNLAHAGSIIFHSECQMQFIGTCLRALVRTGLRSIEVTQEAYDDYVRRLEIELASTVWAHPSVKHSWYKGPDGKVHVLSPWRLVDYWRMTKYPDLDTYILK